MTWAQAELRIMDYTKETDFIVLWYSDLEIIWRDECGRINIWRLRSEN